MLVLEDEGKPGNSEKNPRSKARTNNKLNPLYSNTGPELNLGTLVEGERSHQCAVPAPTRVQ